MLKACVETFECKRTAVKDRNIMNESMYEKKLKKESKNVFFSVCKEN